MENRLTTPRVGSIKRRLAVECALVAVGRRCVSVVSETAMSVLHIKGRS